MIYAMVNAEHGDIIATYQSRGEAESKLAAYVEQHPETQDDMGIRPYANGVPAGDFASAVDVLGDRIAQSHLV